MKPDKDSDEGDGHGPMERGRSPQRKKAKVLADESMPKAGKGKQQQSIKSYGKNGANRDKYIRKNPRNSVPENSQPIEVIIMARSGI